MSYLPLTIKKFIKQCKFTGYHLEELKNFYIHVKLPRGPIPSVLASTQVFYMARNKSRPGHVLFSMYHCVWAVHEYITNHGST